MDYRLNVLLNPEELKQFEDIRKYYENLFQMKTINNSMLLRFIIQKEWNWEHGIELEIKKEET